MYDDYDKVADQYDIVNTVQEMVDDHKDIKISSTMKESKASKQEILKMRQMISHLFKIFDDIPHQGIDIDGMGVQHDINVYDENNPQREGPRKRSPEQEQFIDEKTMELYKRKIIEEGYGAWRAA